MRKLLSLIMFLGAMLSFQVHACDKNTVAVMGAASDLVFQGQDKDLPLDGCYWLAVDDRHVPKPRTLDEAADSIISVMPHWMNLALKRGRGITECVVVVNNVDYLDTLIRAYLGKWEHVGARFSTRSAAEPDRDEVVNAVQALVCRKIKN